MATRVLVVDDSQLMRNLLTQIIQLSPDMKAVGAAADAQSAREMIKSLNPDVLTLDINMPGMDGIEFLDRLMRLRPMPVVMVSALTETASDITLRALELGAVDFIGKPRTDSESAITAYAEELADKIRTARSAHLLRYPAPIESIAPRPFHSSSSSAFGSGQNRVGKIIFVGASTGGTEALKVFLMGMPANCPPILVVQHMPVSFTGSFARRLDTLCPPKVIEAQGNERIEPGTVYIAPGHSHLRIRRGSDAYMTELLQTLPVNRHRPSVDVLFDSAAELVGNQALAVILTGMGKDGAQGMLRMRQAGAKTFGQDEASCVVYGMPREAFAIGAVEEQYSLNEIAPKVLASLGRV